MAGAKRRLTPRNFIVALLGIYLLWIVLSYAWNFVTAMFLEVNMLEKGVLEETLAIEGVLIRDEKVITAPGTGRLNLLMKEGERVRLRARIATVSREAVDGSRGQRETGLFAPVTGLIYFSADGMEGIYTPDWVKKLDRSKISSVSPRKAEVSDGDNVSKGELVGKIINNHAPAYLWGRIKTSTTALKVFKEGRRIKARGSDGDFEMLVSRVRETGGEIEFLLQMKFLPSEFNTKREVAIKLITHRLAGYIIPEGAQVEKDGKSGIYVSYKEKVYWKKIKVLGEIDGKLAIEGLPEGTRYITNPGWTREGKYVPY